jgi:signal transduction histidine kinase
MTERDTHFAHLVSLACHDLRTPLATVHGFARTLTRLTDVDEQAARYLEMMALASRQMAELLDELGLAARIEGRRWEPNAQEVELLELAEAAAGDVSEGEVAVSGRGGLVRADREALQRAVSGLARCAVRHGGLTRVELAASAPELRLSPVGPGVAPILLGEELRDLGAAVAVRVVAALGGSASVEGEALVVRLPVPS